MRKAILTFVILCVAPVAFAQVRIGGGAGVGAEANVNTNVNHGVNTIDNASTSLSTSSRAETDMKNNQIPIMSKACKENKDSAQCKHDRMMSRDFYRAKNATPSAGGSVKSSTDVDADADANAEVK